MWYQLPYPTLIERGKGSRVWDVDGNEYHDFRIGDWVLIHGHGNDTIRDSIVAQLERGTQFGSPEWNLGYRMAALLVERVPSLEKVRFAVSGTDVNQIALRLARTYTGRHKIAKMAGGYHGVADHLLVANGISYDPNPVPAGVLPSAVKEVVVLPFNDPDGSEELIERHAGDLAAVLIEPIMGVAGMLPADRAYLERLREVTARHNIVLIYDEVVTFPVAYGGAQAHYGVIPDLTTLSKSIGGGLPLGAVGGRTEIMNLLEPKLNDWQSSGRGGIDVRRQPGGTGGGHRVPRDAHAGSARPAAGARRPRTSWDRRARAPAWAGVARYGLRAPVRDALGSRAGDRFSQRLRPTTGARSTTSLSPSTTRATTCSRSAPSCSRLPSPNPTSTASSPRPSGRWRPST